MSEMENVAPQTGVERISPMADAPIVKATASRRLLVIDDEPSICDFIRRVAEIQGFEVVTVVTHDRFWETYAALKPSAILLDLMMPNVDGVAMLKQLADRGCDAKLMIMSGFHPELLNNTRKLGAGYDLDMRGTLHKPFGLVELQKALRSLE